MIRDAEDSVDGDAAAGLPADWLGAASKRSSEALAAGLACVRRRVQGLPESTTTQFENAFHAKIFDVEVHHLLAPLSSGTFSASFSFAAFSPAEKSGEVRALQTRLREVEATLRGSVCDSHDWFKDTLASEHWRAVLHSANTFCVVLALCGVCAWWCPRFVLLSIFGAHALLCLLSVVFAFCGDFDL